MSGHLSCLAFVPSKARSRRLPCKNMIPLCGKPMLGHTLDSLRVSGVITDIVVSTEDSRTAEFALSHPNVSVDDRPMPLTEDHVTVWQVLKDYLLRIQKQNKTYDLIGIFLATCPLRSAEDIRQSVQRLNETVDAVVSITSYAFPPQLALKQDSHGLLQSADPSSPYQKGKTTSQLYEKLWRPNGAIYLTRWNHFLKHGNFFTGKVRAYEMPRERSIDVDEAFDLKYAESYLLTHPEQEAVARS
ncbi:acylneuraminate cytidylyltransferase family protein [Omnitrophica bacterium]|nr:acylneuraminate cytidylyltransferase family protein [Candidatus Omnitrophota bacterium]